METPVFLSEMEDDIEGIDSVCLFYETAVSNVLAKFPIKEKKQSVVYFFLTLTILHRPPLFTFTKCFLTDHPGEIDAIGADILLK